MRGYLARMGAIVGASVLLVTAVFAPDAAWGQPTGQRGGPSEPLPIHRLGEGIYGIQGDDVVPGAPRGSMNTGVVVGDDGVFVFGCNDENFNARLAAIRTVTDKPIRWSANGHMASDDSGCNPELRAMGATLFGSTLMREHYLEWMPARIALGMSTPQGRARFDGRPMAPPDVTFDDEMVLHLGEGRRVHLQWMGTGHTVGDTVAYMPEQGVLFTADLLFVELHPTVRDGDSRNWQRILDRMMGWDVRWIVPGHGRVVQGKDSLAALSRYYDWMREQVRAGMQWGLRPQEILEQLDRGEFASWGRTDAMFETVETLYHELEAEGVRAGGG
jgi:glyoxylase-like metal-dependent hydrolase (beta-lactamase superfamily II)